MKWLCRVLYVACIIIWITNFVTFLNGRTPSNFDIGFTMIITVVFFIRAIFDTLETR